MTELNRDTMEFAIRTISGKSAAIFTCAGGDCKEVLTINGISGKSPPLVRKLAIESGWDVTEAKAHRNRCPACQRRKNRKHDPESELKRIKPLFPQLPAALSPQPEPAIGVSAMGEPISIKPPIPPTSTQLPGSVRQPTVDQRAAIRRLLDAHFDDSTGRYLVQQSDRTIAEKLGLPAIMVRTIREAAYGPELEDPELAAIRDEITRLDTALSELRGRLKALEQRK